MELEQLQSVLSLVRPSGLLTGLFVLGLTWAIARALSTTLMTFSTRLGERRLLLQQIAAFVRFGVYFVGFVIAFLVTFELRDETVLALSGTAGVALGFALKDLASAVLAGLTILVDKPFQVGDRVRIGETYGDVINIGLRSVRIVTLDDNLVTIPNNRFLTESVASGNAGELNMLVQMDFYIGLGQDTERAVQLTEAALTTSRFCFLDKPWTVLVNQVVVGDSFAVRLRAKAYVLDTKYETAFVSDVTRRLMPALQKARIAPPSRLLKQLQGAA